ncbi:hypothetical protein G8C15_10720 [Enterococcus casseliflavus]|nr:hypothetical protein [Enterococcus casseliflavus]
MEQQTNNSKNYDYHSEMKRIEEKEINATNIDTSVFEELLNRDVSEDTKALVEAQREIYKSQYAIVDMVEFRGQQTYMAIFSTQNQLDQIYQTINENQIKLQESVEVLSGHVESIDANLSERGDSSETIEAIKENLERSTEQFETLRVNLDENLVKLNETNEEMAFYIQNVSENTYVPEERQEIEYFAFIAIVAVLVMFLPVYFIGRVIFGFVNNLLKGLI